MAPARRGLGENALMRLDGGVAAGEGYSLLSGAMAKLTYLGLSENQIGNEGMQALSSAIANGAMGLLTVSPSLLPSPPVAYPHVPFASCTGTSLVQQQYWG